MRAVSVAVAAVALVVLALGLPLVVLEQPFFTASLSERYSLSQAADLTPEQTAALAEQVRAFVVDRRGELPETVDGRPAFDAGAVSHLRDVAAVMSGARTATGVAALFVLVWGGVMLARRDSGAIARALVWGAIGIGVAVVIALAAALVDFDAVFSGFHAIFFAEGTWTFPYDSLLIRLFPEPFWSAAGLAWALGIGAMAALYAACGAAVRRRAREAA